MQTWLLQIWPLPQPQTPFVQQPPLGQVFGWTQVPVAELQQRLSWPQGEQMPFVGSHCIHVLQVATQWPPAPEQQPPWLHFATHLPFSQQVPLVQHFASAPVPHLAPVVQGWHVPLPFGSQICVLSQQLVSLWLLSKQGV
jgi:hypothetical protein